MLAASRAPRANLLQFTTFCVALGSVSPTRQWLLSMALWIVIYDNINRRHNVVIATEETNASILDPALVHAARQAGKRLALHVVPHLLGWRLAKAVRVMRA